MRELQGVSAYWDEQVELSAQVLDAIRAQTFYLLKMNGNTPDAPVPTPRPGRDQAKPESISLADFAALIGE